jgi:Nucleotidyl transferase AbiEii toxin, Type IV TA system
VSLQRPTRQTVAGRAYLDLQKLARQQRRPTDELQQLYALECFLDRLSASTHAEDIVLKGGVLLAAYDARRPTRDIDVQAQRTPNRSADILQLVCDVAAIPIEDGLTFDTAGATAETIRDEDEYSGVRVTLTATLAAARLHLHVDVNVGDPIWPAPRTIAFPRLFGGTIRLSGYPLPMVYAEKIVTALQRGTANTRWRDFADLYLLTARHPTAGSDLRRALAAVATYRGTNLESLADTLDGYAALAQRRWAAWRRRQRLDDRLPVEFADVLAVVIEFAEAPLTTDITDRVWHPQTRQWQSIG